MGRAGKRESPPGWSTITDRLLEELEPLEFATPVAAVYNPVVYARKSHDLYLERFGSPPREVLMLGMNPGPWGMAQTGVPFGEIAAVRDWLGITAPVARPLEEHPKRPILGFECPRSEVSGRRVWGWARERFETPERFFERFFIANYCPLAFLEESGRNRTPDKLPRAERDLLFDGCDRALRATVDLLQPETVLGFGKFATERARKALEGRNLRIVSVLHPSPANPRANRGWATEMDRALDELDSGSGIEGKERTPNTLDR